MVKITHALQKVKNANNYGISETTILDVTDAVKHKFRQRKLGPVQTIHLFLAQILNGIGKADYSTGVNVDAARRYIREPIAHLAQGEMSYREPDRGGGTSAPSQNQ